MTPEGGRRWGHSWLDTGGKKYPVFFQIRIDLRHHNAHSRLSPSLAMHKTGQWCCLIQIFDFFAVWSSSANKRRSSMSLRSVGFFNAQSERTPLSNVSGNTMQNSSL